MYVTWKHLGLPDPTPLQYEIADFLQSNEKRKMVEAFRGIGKSWITSAYVLWRLLNDPDYKVLVVSASKSRSDDFAAFTKRLIHEMPLFQHLKADPKKKHRDSMIAFDVGPCKPAHAPSVKSAGIFGQLSGSRANEIIGDDVEVPNNSATEDLREKLERATTEFEAIIVPGGRITYLGTPQSEESVYNNLPQRGYEVVIWPCRYTNKDYSKQGQLAKSIKESLEANEELLNKPTDPRRFDDLDLLEREASYGKSGFMLQFMLDTSLSDAERYPLKTGDLVVMSLGETKAPLNLQFASSPEQLVKELPNVGFTGDRWYRPMWVDEVWTEYEGSVMFIDPSGRGKDECGYAVVKQLHGFLYLTACGGLVGGYEDTTLTKLAEVAKDNKVNLIVTESNFGDGMFNRIFLPILNRAYPGCGLEEVRHSKQKELRIIDTLEPVMNRHKLIVDYNVIKDDTQIKDDRDIKYSLFYQLTRITKDRGALRHDDRLDAVAGAVAYWVESMSRDELVAVDEHNEQLLDKELEVFIEHAIGFK